MAGSLLLCRVSKYRDAWGDRLLRGMSVAFCCLAAAVVAAVSRGDPLAFTFSGAAGFGISLTADGFRGIYGLLTAFLWLVTSLFSKDYFAHSSHQSRYRLFNQLTFGATMGVLFSADLLTTFLFFELVSLFSYALVAHEETPQSLRAADTYLAVAVIGGLVMLMGLFLLHHYAGTLEIAALYNACQNLAKPTRYLIGGLLLTGFGAKAGMFPLHVWLPKAHPQAPAPASALLSGILTKSGIFGVLVINCELFRQDFAWGLGLVLLGSVTMVLGAVLAIFSINLKRTLACSSVSQMGFVVVGIGMQCLLGSHNSLAVRGTLLHMVNHSLVKLVLFVAAGVIYLNLHQLHLDDIRGFGRGKPLLAFVFLMGALSLGGVPFFPGYLSKTLLHESIVEYLWMLPDYAFPARLMQGVEMAFLLTGGMTVAYLTKLFVTIFVEKNPRQNELDAPREPYCSKTTGVALVLSACLLPILGIFPALADGVADLGQDFLRGHSPEYPVAYFAWVNLKGAFASLTIGAILYLLIVRGVLGKKEGETLTYPERWPRFLDVEDSLYRPLLEGICHVGAALMRLLATLPDALIRAIRDGGATLMRLLAALPGALVGAVCAGATAILKLMAGLPDAVVGAINRGGFCLAQALDGLLDGLVSRLQQWFLRPARPKPFPGRLLGSFCRVLFPSDEEEPPPRPVFTESISYGLLLFSLGIVAMLLYVFVHAWQTIR